MESSTTIKGMTQGNQIFVPNYQRAYSWEVGKNPSEKKQVETFLADLEDYLASKAASKNTDDFSPYYFGHFLYEKTGDCEYAIIDGQQRLTTITIFVSALFSSIEENRELTDKEKILKECLIKHYGTYQFKTVDYDDQLFKDYVINKVKKDHGGIETTSSQRIVDAYDYLSKKISEMPMYKRESLLQTVANASCTTHVVKGKAEAIQMFIFQNNRGKRPSNLEVIKAQFMYHIHINGGTETEVMIKEVENRFGKIYHSISSIENFVDEDSVLTITLKVHFNSLWEDNSIEKINAELAKPTQLDFIREFSLALEKSFERLSRLNNDREKDVNIEASLLCGRFNIVLPFFVKAYGNDMSKTDISRMAKAIGDIVLRDAIIKTRADLRSRLNDVFQKMEYSPDDIIDRVEFLKRTSDWWWAYWNNDAFKIDMEGNWYSNYHGIAKIILWKYENYLVSNEGKGGYGSMHYGSIKDPHLEHIAPQTEKESEQIATGYDIYDEDFKERFLYCIGNFLLLSAPHNESIGNKPFEIKRATYNQLRQQREIQEMTEVDHLWDRKKIQYRKDKLVSFVLENL
jgi:hypothetical protein